MSIRLPRVDHVHCNFCGKEMTNKYTVTKITREYWDEINDRWNTYVSFICPECEREDHKIRNYYKDIISPPAKAGKAEIPVEGEPLDQVFEEGLSDSKKKVN